MNLDDTIPREVKDGRWPYQWLFVAGIVTLAFLLRIQNLEKQSAWIDDYQIASVIDAPTANTYLELLRIRAKDLLPAYYYVLYGWHRLYGGDVSSLRLVNVIFNVMSLPLLFVLIRSVFGRRAAFLAVTCMALSPTQIYYAQSLSLYSFLILLSIDSMYALRRALDTLHVWWWLLFFVANLVLLWTHAFTAFFVCIECAFILWNCRTRLRLLFTVLGIQFVIGLSPLLFLYQTLGDVTKPEEDFAYQLPPVKALLADWVADDAVMTVDPFSFQGQTWGFLSTTLQQHVIDAHRWIDWGMIGFFGLLAAGCLWTVVKTLLSAGSASARGTPHEVARGALLILGVAFLPLVIHVILTVTWRPVILQRFTCYSAPAMYAVIGAGVAFIARENLRKAAIVALLCLYAYQLSLAIPATQRTDYLGAARHIAECAQPSDTVLVTGCFMSWEVFRFNAGRTPYPILPAYSFKALCGKAKQLLEDGAAPNQTVWAVIEPFVFTLPPLEQLERGLSGMGLAWSRTDLPGMNKLFLYQIKRGGPNTPTAVKLPSMTARTDYPPILSDLGYEPNDRATYDSALERLQNVWDTEFLRTTLFYSYLALQAAAEGYTGLSLRAAERAVVLDNKAAFAHFVRAIVLGEAGKPTEADAAFQQALTCDLVGYVPLYRPLFDSFYLREDAASTAGEFSRMEKMHAYMPFVWYVRAGVMPGSPKVLSSRESQADRPQYRNYGHLDATSGWLRLANIPCSSYLDALKESSL